MNTQRFVDRLLNWVDLMDEGKFAMAHSRSLDIAAVGLPLAEKMDLTKESLGLQTWQNKSSRELLEGLTGFLACLASVCEAEAAAGRERESAGDA
ncbi:MAG: hypothetical protein AB7K52_00620 [Phycisphaerales bacterium]